MRKLRKILRYIGVIALLLFCLFCLIRTSQTNAWINEQVQSNYAKTSKGVSVTLKNGKDVQMRFGESSVQIEDSHLYSKKEACEILLFVRKYVKEQGYHIPRSNTELIGEFRLHTLLYRIGYRTDKTKDLDWDYKKDDRWYVNVASQILGWCGV